jgi:hypothetical protein
MFWSPYFIFRDIEFMYIFHDVLLPGKWYQTGSENDPAAWQFGSNGNDDKQISYNYIMFKEEIESFSEYIYAWSMGHIHTSQA